MPPNNNKGIEVISLLDDSDVEDGAMASGGGAASTKRPSPTSAAASANRREMKKKRRKESASTFVESSDAIELLDDSEDEAPAMGTKNVEASEPPAAGDIKPTVVGATASATGPADSDIEEVEVSAPTTTSSTSGWRPAGGGTGQPKDDRAYDSDAPGNGNDEQEKKSANDEEFEIVATKGQNALADFPHSRANCVTHPFASGGDKKAHCDNCYCYVCDMPAADCKVWDSHCEANHEDRRWREERERFKRLGVEAALAPAPAPVSAPIATAARSQPAAAARAQAIVTKKKKKSSTGPNPELSVRKLLQKLTAVHPVEISPPSGSGFTTDLRHYQKQSLAFLVDVERTSATDNQKMRGGWLADEVGMGKTAVVLALVATNPTVESVLPSEQEIRSHVSELNSRESKRASAVLDFKHERIEYMRPYEEAVAALEPTDPGQPYEKYCQYQAARKELRDQNAKKSIEYEELLDSLSRKHKMDKLKLKGTVILTSVSLMGQWEDEVEKHAPGLTIKTFHSSRRSNPLFVNLSLGHRSRKVRDGDGKDHTTSPDECNADSMVELSKADVIISSSTIWWPKLVAKGFEFRRVVHDESHLFGGPSAKVEAANYISSQFRWCVTATPLASSFRDLGRQLEFIWGKERWGAGGAYQGDYNEIERATRTGNDSQEQFDRLVGILGRYLIRHTKSQRIGGEEILALPPSTTSTVMLTMSKDEDKALNKVHTTSKVLNRCLEGGGETFTIERCFGFPLGSILRSDTSDKDY